MPDETKTDILFEAPVALGVHVFQILKEQIITGKLKEGARLNELALQKIFGTSRPPIREAFHRLETEGLVEITHRRGVFVRSISVRDVIEATAIRGCLEALALRIAEKPLDPAWLKELGHILQEMEEAKEKQDREGFTSLHWRFHKAIIGVAGNRILERIYPWVTEPFISDRLTYRFLKEPEKFDGVGHREIYDLLAARRVSEAARMVERHANAFVGYMDVAETVKTRKGHGKKETG